MAIYLQDIVDINLNGGMIHRNFKSVAIGSGDQNANRFGMRVHRDGVPEDLTGVSCQAVFQDPMGNNIALTSHGTVSGNVAYVTLPQACYNYEGRFCLAIKLIGGGVTGTMRIVDGVINNTHTGGTVAPTGAVPTYQEVLAAYDDAIAAVEDVNELKSALALEADRSMIDMSGFKPGDYAPYKTWENAALKHEIHPGIIKLDGTSSGGRLVSLLGSDSKYANATTPSANQLAEGPFSIVSGHKYKLSIKLVSGTISDAEKMYLSLFGTDGTTVIATAYIGDETIFTSDVSQIGQLCYFTYKNTTWTNAVFIYKLVDLTIEREQMEKIAPFYENLTGTANSGQLCIYGGALKRRVERGTESSSEFFASHWKDTTIDQEFDNKTTAVNGFISAINGGESMVVFEQGSASAGSGHLVPSNSAKTIRTRFDCLPFMIKGDVVAVGSGFESLISKVKLDTEGIVQEYGLGWSGASSRTIPEDGLYFIYMRKTLEEGETTRDDITPAEGEAALTINHIGLQISTHASKSELKKNPYERIPWDDVSDVVSVSHAHCTTQEQFDTLKGKYRHIALSNYHPSKAWYPLDKHFENIGDAIGSPNAEHAYFTGVPSKCHMNSLGSYYSDPTDNPWGGTPEEFIGETMKGMKMAAGGGVTINHPYWSGLTAAKIIDIMNATSGVIALEVWNATCERDNSKGNAEAIWDGVLSNGTQIFATAVPDHEAQYHPNEDTYGFGYNHMLVTNETEEEILNAYKIGRFYATLYNDGLTLEEIGIASGTLSIEVSEAAVFKFVTATRTVTTETASTTGTFEIQSDDVYVRVEATRGSNKLWTNAIML